MDASTRGGYGSHHGATPAVFHTSAVPSSVSSFFSAGVILILGFLSPFFVTNNLCMSRNLSPSCFSNFIV